MIEVPLTVNLIHIKHPDFNSESEIHAIKYCLTTIGGYLEHYEILTCDKEEIKKCLNSLDDKDQSNIAILVGDTVLNLTLSNIVYDAIEEIADDNTTDDLNELLLNLTEKLKLTFNCAICKIRRQSLIINMCGPLEYVPPFMEETVNEMLQIIFLMGSYELNESSSNNNDCDVSDENTNLDQIFPLNLSDEETVQPEKEHSVEVVYRKPMETRMISVQDAIYMMRTIIYKKERDIYRTRITTVNTNDAQGKILASDILSTVSVPSYRNSTKHGYAVLASDRKGTRKVLATSQTKNSETSSFCLVPGTCVRIRSGEPIPIGATAVVKLEDTMIMEDNVNDNAYFDVEDKEYEINVSMTPKINENIRNIGCEINLDDHVLRKYTRIGPAELNILTLCGLNSIKVIGQPSVGLLSIGNELVEPGNNLTPGCIYDSNKITLISLLREKDFHDTVDFGISPYEYKAICDKIGDALEKVDVLVIMGHANDRDILKSLLIESYKAVIHFGRVNMKPGKSTTFASCKFNGKNKYFLCMSANPVTVPFVAHIFLITLLNRLRCYHFQEPVLQTCMISRQELHTRPKYLWTTITWDTEGEEMFSRAHLNNQNEMKHPKANGILMLPQRAPDLSFLDAAFVQAIYFGK